MEKLPVISCAAHVVRLSFGGKLDARGSLGWNATDGVDDDLSPAVLVIPATAE